MESNDRVRWENFMKVLGYILRVPGITAEANNGCGAGVGLLGSNADPL
jgi:hypothetical protein